MEKMQHNPADLQTDEISLKELLGRFHYWIQFLLKKWHIVVIAGVIGAAIGFLYAKRKKPIYTATTTFVLEGADKGNSLAQYAGIASMIGVDLGGGSEGIFQGDNLLELYKSRKMLESTLLLPSPSDSSLLLIDRYLAFSPITERASFDKFKELNIKGEFSSTFSRLRDSILQEVVVRINKHNLIVGKVDKKLSIFKIDVQSPNETFSKEFNELLVKQVNDFYVMTKTKKSLDNIAILQRKTDSVRSVMNNDIGTMAAVMDATPNLNPARQAQRIVPTQRSQFSAETNKAILSQLVQNLELTKISLMKETPLIEVLDEPRYPVGKKAFSVITYSVIGGVVSSIILLFILSIMWWFSKLS